MFVSDISNRDADSIWTGYIRRWSINPLAARGRVSRSTQTSPPKWTECFHTIFPVCWSAAGICFNNTAPTVIDNISPPPRRANNGEHKSCACACVAQHAFPLNIPPGGFNWGGGSALETARCRAGNGRDVRRVGCLQISHGPSPHPSHSERLCSAVSQLFITKTLTAVFLQLVISLYRRR